MFKKIALITLFILVTLSLNAQNSIMTYNIRYDNPNDRENWWENRKQEVVDMIKHYQPDLLGIQEGLISQVKFLDSSLTNYSYVGVGRDDGIEKGEFTAVFFNKKTIELLETKTYWLSGSPDSVSVGWDASMERIVTYGQFRDRSNKEIVHVFNCHFDHIGALSREKSAELILELIKNKGIEDERIAVIGDLNCLPKERPIELLKTKLEDSYEVSQSAPYGPIGTFNGFNTEKKAVKRIDYIFIKNIIVEEYINIDDRRKNNLWLSDHMPLLIKMK